MQARIIFKGDNELFLKGSEGQKRALPTDLYHKLAAISDPYSSSKEFIGYVDPNLGVVLVDAATLTDPRTRPFSVSWGQHDMDSDNGSGSIDLGQFLRNVGSAGESLYLRPPTPTLPEEEETPNPHASSSAKPQAHGAAPHKQKTLHQLAYERKTGRALPEDDTRPISGFGIKYGMLLVNSTTFNAYRDEFHTEERTMGMEEKEKLEQLVVQLMYLELQRNEEAGALLQRASLRMHFPLLRPLLLQGGVAKVRCHAKTEDIYDAADEQLLRTQSLYYQASEYGSYSQSSSGSALTATIANRSVLLLVVLLVEFLLPMRSLAKYRSPEHNTAIVVCSLPTQCSLNSPQPCIV